MHAPPALRLKPGGGHDPSAISYNAITGQPEEYGGAGFRKAAFAEVKDFFDNPNASRANAMNPYLVMQANLYVTQVRILVFLCLALAYDWILATRPLRYRAISR